MERAEVIVIGGGNAGLCAAMKAAETVDKVVLIEKSPEIYRGGNSKYTRDIRCGREGTEPSNRYSEDEFLDDLLRVTNKDTNFDLAKLTIKESFNIPDWMGKHGVKWQPALRGTLHLGRTNRFFIGGGKALINAYYDFAAKQKVNVMYDSTVTELKFQDSEFQSLTIASNGEKREFQAKSLVVASGGFEANVPWLKEYWGDRASNFIIRGCKFNDGHILRILLDHGAMPFGSPKDFHAVAVDARSPKFDGGIVTRIDSLPFGIVVNIHGERFYDEGEDLWPKRYAIWGKLIAEQPNQMAYSIVDSTVVGNFLPPMYGAFQSDSIEELGKQIKIDFESLKDTIKNYNDHVARGKKYDPSLLDECGTIGITPPKTHWALPLESPPFYAYPLSPGITFTYHGVKVNQRARVISTEGTPLRNVYAAGEIMAGNILTRGYLAGFGLTIGTTFGRIAGEEAANHV